MAWIMQRCEPPLVSHEWVVVVLLCFMNHCDSGASQASGTPDLQPRDRGVLAD
ncbi:hypothetical protein M758_3G266000 [Ceratodon purpureus]|uniref:Uncharacterized protein n=1 Tax=Ceratodon purpureus TaxID=3225 RepID=A0A8T0IQT1_CERPU|nr:hypothetical protein KC19_3G265200 [Ceratodon purpureus]KAG0624669.1 hypothetical protein M758_3G266000 [Ceratodon purpureus]